MLANERYDDSFYSSLFLTIVNEWKNCTASVPHSVHVMTHNVGNNAYSIQYYYVLPQRRRNMENALMRANFDSIRYGIEL